MAIDTQKKEAPHSKRAARNRGIRQALMTSVIARMSGLLLQVVSLPIAAIQLGPAGFSIYAMLAAILAALTLSNLGMSQATTLHMSRALATDDPAAARQMLAASLIIVGAIAATASAAIAMVVIYSPLLSLVFAQHLENTMPPVPAALFVCFVFLATQILSVMEAAQLAQQHQHRLNIATSIGTLVAAGAVCWVASAAPTVIGILFALHLPVLLARTVNAITTWVDLRPNLHDLATVWIHARRILADGLRFVSGTMVANFLCHPFSVLVVGMYAAPLPSASYAAVVNAVLMFGAISGYAMSPFRGSIPEASQNGDILWLKKSYKYSTFSVVAINSAPAIALSLFGSEVFQFWYAGSIDPSKYLTFFAGIYLFLIGIEMVNFTFLSNLGSLSYASKFIFFKGLISAAVTVIFGKLGFSEYLIIIFILANILFSLIPLTCRALSIISTRESAR